MEISFNTTEESNEKQSASFLQLSHSERFNSWLNLMHRSKQLIPQKEHHKNNFVINITK